MIDSTVKINDDISVEEIEVILCEVPWLFKSNEDGVNMGPRQANDEELPMSPHQPHVMPFKVQRKHRRVSTAPAIPHAYTWSCAAPLVPPVVDSPPTVSLSRQNSFDSSISEVSSSSESSCDNTGGFLAGAELITITQPLPVPGTSQKNSSNSFSTPPTLVSTANSSFTSYSKTTLYNKPPATPQRPLHLPRPRPINSTLPRGSIQKPAFVGRPRSCSAAQINGPAFAYLLDERTYTHQRESSSSLSQTRTCPSPELLGQRPKHQRTPSSKSDSPAFPIVGYVNEDQKKMVEDNQIKVVQSESFEEEIEESRRRKNVLKTEMMYVCSRFSKPFTFMKKDPKLKRASGCLT